VLLVCNGSGAQPCPSGAHFTTIQTAVDAAHSGDWVLIWPGVYHEKGTPQAGVYITTPGLHLRGLDRNRVIVDGTNPGGARPCTDEAAFQDLAAGGRNGIEAYKAPGVSIENLTVCNYLGDTEGHRGNQVWWNFGDGSGQAMAGAWNGSYLSATSTFWGGDRVPMAMYGLFVSNSNGPGRLNQSYAANMGDSGVYVGACADCNAVLSSLHIENSALGFSGTNAGGHLVIETSEWDLNRTGIVPNSLNNDDAPPPQTGLCPGSTTESCTLIRNNHVHDNNNPNVPTFGIAGSGAVGAGIQVAGGSFDTLSGNRIDHQGSWGIVIHDFPDSETPPPISTCQGGVQLPGVCLFIAKGNLVHDNRFAGNGFFGNPTNGDLANESTSAPGNCFYRNHDTGGPLTSDPPDIQSPAVDGPPCGRPTPGDGTLLVAQLVCATGIAGPCPPAPGLSYPQRTQVRMLPLAAQATMPNPCVGVPTNPWCRT
jgi:hypothetical protein